LGLDDEILINGQNYNAVKNIARHAVQRCGAKLERFQAKWNHLTARKTPPNKGSERFP
jgi:hypothetical protein